MTYEPTYHPTLAAIAFPLLLRLLLAKESKYQPNAEDWAQLLRSANSSRKCSQTARSIRFELAASHCRYEAEGWCVIRKNAVESRSIIDGGNKRAWTVRLLSHRWSIVDADHNVSNS